MPGLPTGDGDRLGRLGGGIGYPLDRLHEEGAYIAYHFHWSPDVILDMEHRDRERWVGEIAKINRRLNEGAS